MRTGSFTMQQTLTPEAAGVIKQAVTLARRRGHAQVTPLHVANTMLSASSGLLRTACLQSHSHPLQCKALELCFNVALNRLPASSSSPILGPHSHHTSISNALVAAFKRAQAHQRRGSIESQQQPLLAVKIELEQLVISILDDPSVSRVMREAGFYSTQVKSNVEQAVSLELSSQTPPPCSKPKESNLIILSQSPPLSQIEEKLGRPRVNDDVRNEDIMGIIENLMNKRRKSLVIVGECLASIEGVIGGVMENIDKGDVPEALREVKFISIPLFPFGPLSRGEVAQELGELRCLVNSFVDKGVVLYVGDLDWLTNYRASCGGQGRGYYCPVEHMVVELGRLVCGIGETGRFWLLGIASFQTYMRCRTGYPSLETVWGLHPLTVPAGSLGLSLIPDSDIQSESGSKKAINWWLQLEGIEENQITCCADCSAKFKIEALSLRNSTFKKESTSSSLPSWLKDESKRLNVNEQVIISSPLSKLSSNEKLSNTYCPDLTQEPLVSQRQDDIMREPFTVLMQSVHYPKWGEQKILRIQTDFLLFMTSSFIQDCLSIKELRKKWNSICSSVHKQPSSCDKILTISSISPSSSTSCFSCERQDLSLHQTHQPWPVFKPKQPFWASAFMDKQTFLSNPNSNRNSTSSSDNMETDYVQRLKEFNAENLKTLCSALEKKVPWQKDIIPEIAATILQCRSGMIRRKEKVDEAKEETWFFFQGVDAQAKEKIGRELAKVVFGSHSKFESIALSSFSSLRANSNDDFSNKRSRNEQSCSYIERFLEVVSNNPHRVFLVEDVEHMDYCSQMGIKRVIDRGKISNSNGDEVSLKDAIIILSCEDFSSRLRTCSPPVKLKSEEERGFGLEDTSACLSLDLNMSCGGGNDGVEDQSIDDIGLLESVDRCIIFRIQEL